MKLYPKLFASLGLILTAVILLSIMLIKSTQNNKTVIPTPTPKETIINPAQTNAVREKVVNLAIEDLISTENFKKEDIKIKSVSKREWPDASLGCPKPGSFYAQVITPGYQIILEADQKSYSYHTSLERVVRCDRG